MSVDWRALATQLGHAAGQDDIVITLASERRQRVMVDAKPGAEALRLWSVILGPAATAELQDGSPFEYAWERNRLSDLVGFSVDGRGRLIGETWVPASAMSRELFDLSLSELARVCDWHESRLSGDDLY